MGKPRNRFSFDKYDQKCLSNSFVRKDQGFYFASLVTASTRAKILNPHHSEPMRAAKLPNPSNAHI